MKLTLNNIFEVFQSLANKNRSFFIKIESKNYLVKFKFDPTIKLL